MADLPTGIVTLLFTDIEGSTRLWEQHPEAMSAASARHDALLSTGIQQQGGVVVKSRGEGDSLFAVFAQATDAAAAACALQQALLTEPWPTPSPLRVRMALHTAVAELRDGDYYGLGVNRCARLRAVAHGGQVLLSQVTADRVRDQLPAGVSLRDLGSHRLKDLQQPEQLFQLLHPALPADFPPLRSLAAFAHNLPVQLTRFIGREQAMAEVKRLLATSHLLTLTGSGGCGKTRLALQAAADLLEEYADGVWLVELAALADPALVAQTVAAALGVREEPGRPLTATLGEYLRPKQALLVVDNCEHLLAACAQLAESLLQACPKLRILASSREGLGIRGEQTYRVPSLSLPDARHPPPLERLQEFEAVQLFADRARLSQATFAVTPANAPAVVQVCERLDGIPLAIELAAARVKALPVEKLNERLDDMFRLLTGGSRTALPRQQTLRALIDWSYELLAEAERALLRRLSAFAGGWTLEAAEAVTCGEAGGGCVGEGLEEWEVLDLLTSLVEKSLVLYEEREGEGRYRLLETVRQYARDRMLESGEAERVRGRHRDWFLRLSEEIDPQLSGGEGGVWFETLEQAARAGQLETEHDNLRAALEWSLAQEGDAETALRLAGALGWFWEARGYWSEGQERLSAALSRRGGVSAALRAKALRRAGQLAGDLSDYGEARRFLEESLAISRELGDQSGIAQSLSHLGWTLYCQADHATARSLFEECLWINRELGRRAAAAMTLSHLGWVALAQGDQAAARALFEEDLAVERALGDKRGIASALNCMGCLAHTQGDYALARSLLEESLAMHRELGNKLGIVWSLHNLGRVASHQGSYEEARVLLEESLAIFRELEDKRGVAYSLNCLGFMAREQGDLGAARALIEESLAISRELGEKRGIAWSLTGLGWSAHGQGDNGEARAFFGESLAMGREAGHKPRIAANLEGLAAVAVAQGQPERAARLFGAAEGLREAMGAPLPPAERAEHDRSVAAVRAALGEEAFAAAWAEGRAMTLQDAIEYALAPGRPQATGPGAADAQEL